MKRFTLLFVTICAGVVATRASTVDALWDRTAEKVRQGQAFLPAETNITSEVLKGNGGVFRTFAVIVKRSVQDGRVVQELVRDKPSGKRGQGDEMRGSDNRNAEGQSSSPLRSLLEGTALSPFAETVKLEALNSGETSTIDGENAVLYAVQWTDEAGYAFSGSVWISPAKELPLKADYIMKKHPRGAEIKELRASINFGIFEDLPVRALQIVEAKVAVPLFLSIDLRSTTKYSLYFDPPKEND